jgi:hypothetical protein
MASFKITAQAFTTSRQIAKVVQAVNEAAALRMVSAELDAAGFYPVSIVAV